jgi:hypothetical protein
VSYIHWAWARAQLHGWTDSPADKMVEAISHADPPFYGVIMLAMWRADTPNLARLRGAWPEVYAELQARYNAPAGLLDTDSDGLRDKVLGLEEAREYGAFD